MSGYTKDQLLLRPVFVCSMGAYTKDQLLLRPVLSVLWVVIQNTTYY